MEAAEAASMDGLMGGLEQSLPTGSSTLRDFEISLNKSAEKNAGRSWTVEELPYLLGDNSGGLTNNVLGASSKSGQEGDGGMQGFKQDQKSDFVDSRAGSGDLNPMEFSLPFPQGMVEGTQTMNGRTVVQNNSMAPTGLDQSANVEKIKTAAESLATQGGGEVKVILQPEGLGTVQLKVRMHEGKIQVQMKADNQESQKLLESSLTDLRQSLSNQKIAVDSVKVDVGGDLTRQDQSNQFASQNFDQGREQARQFMSQFRQENFFNRQPMFDAPGFKSYRSQREDSINPVAENIRPRSSTARGTGREINVVA